MFGGTETQSPKSHLFAFAKFGVIGAITAAIYFLAMWFIFEFFVLPYFVVVSLAYILSTVFHFLANKSFTFADSSDSHFGQISRYLVMWLINYLITIFIVGFSVETYKLSPYLGVCVSVLFTMCVGYILGRFWVFKVNEETV